MYLCICLSHSLSLSLSFSLCLCVCLSLFLSFSLSLSLYLSVCLSVFLSVFLSLSLSLSHSLGFSPSLQVAQLIMLHEEAQEGRIVADLLPPVSAVSAAVQNLITVSLYFIVQCMSHTWTCTCSMLIHVQCRLCFINFLSHCGCLFVVFVCNCFYAFC